MMQSFVVPLTVLFMVVNTMESDAACNKDCFLITQGSGPLIHGSGKLATEARRVDRFNAVSVIASAKIQIEQTGTPSLTITGDDNLLPLLTTEVKGGELTLAVAQGKSVEGTVPTYRITVGDLSLVDISGSGDITISKFDGPSLKLLITGSGNIKIAGKVNDFEVDNSGSGDIDARSLTAKRAKIDIGGAGNVSINVTESLDVDVGGSGDVIYTGSPRVTQDIFGAGSVRRGR
jgi:hypothetical protein